MNYKQLIVYTAVIVVATVVATKYYFPSIEEKIRIEEKEVIKRDVVTRIVEIIKPDGSKETQTEIIDRTKEKITKEFESLKIQKKDWFIAGGASLNINDVTPVYNFQVNRRVLGPFYIGASVNTRKDIGVLIGFEF
jgi:hypothetical protein